MSKTYMINSSYYRSKIHRAICPICNYEEKVRKTVNKKILKGESMDIIKHYIFIKHPNYPEEDKELFDDIIYHHAEYLATIIYDVKSKTMYRSIRDELELKNVDIFNLKLHEKVNLITKIESELILDKCDINDENTSVIKALTSETIPLLIGRLNKETVTGNSQSVKSLSTSVTAALNSLIELQKKTKDSPEELKETDRMELLEGDSTGKENIVSLSDRIQQAVGKSD